MRYNSNVYINNNKKINQQTRNESEHDVEDMEVSESSSLHFAGYTDTDTELEDTTDEECDPMLSSDEDLPLVPEEMETEGRFSLYFCMTVYRFIKALFLGRFKLTFLYDCI